MARKPDEFIVHLLMSGGHREQVRFATIKDFQKWYSTELVPKADSDDFITVPIGNIQWEYMVVRPSTIQSLRVEPVFFGTVDRDSMLDLE